MREHLSGVEYREFLVGAAYLCVGERADAKNRDTDPQGGQVGSIEYTDDGATFEQPNRLA